MEEILNAEQLAGYLKIPVSSVYAKVRSGDIPTIRIGRLYRFRKADIDRWLGAQKVEIEDPSRIVDQILYSMGKKGYHNEAGKTRSNRRGGAKCS